MIKIEINGQTIETEDGAMVIEAADKAGIVIPRFCYHKKLSIAANCRMCLVEVEKAGKPQPACATPVTEGMRIFTQSPKALAAQKGVMEFLLINHPLDCPICDQGGECELQDIAVGYGKDVSRYQEGKRVVKDKNLGPLIATDMTRCIHCTRCVRFGEEIAGIKELGATGRGEHMSIGTYVENTVDSEMSGNVIDLCPVGALTSKPFRFSARSWELQNQKSIAPHDLVGSNLIVQTRRGKVMRVLPDENEAINETWISNRDRFSYLGLSHEQRLKTPKVKNNQVWQEVDWQRAFDEAVKALKQTAAKHGADQIGMIVSPSATVEEAYLAQQMIRKLGCANIDHRIWQTDVSRQDAQTMYPGLGCRIEDMEKLDACLLVGSNVRKEQPIIAHRLRKAVINNGAQISSMHQVGYPFHFPLANEIVAAPEQLLEELAGIAHAVMKEPGKSISQLDSLTNSIKPTAKQQAVARSLIKAKRKAVLLGPGVSMHPQFSLFEALAQGISECLQSTLGYLTIGANVSGNCIGGALPHRGPCGEKPDKLGLDVQSMYEQQLKTYMLFGVEPGFDELHPHLARKALQNADSVLVFSSFENQVMHDLADVLMPIAAFTETPGTFINGEGEWQSFSAVVNPPEESRPGWKVLRVLGNLLALPGFDYTQSEQIRDELKQKYQSQHPGWDFWKPAIKKLNGQKPPWQVVPYLAANSIDGLTRRSEPLIESENAFIRAATINKKAADDLGVSEGDMLQITQNGESYHLPVHINNAVSDGCVLVPVANSATMTRGAPFSAGKLAKHELKTAVNE